MGTMRLRGEPRWQGRVRLTTWYYAVGPDDTLHRLKQRRAEDLLLSPAGDDTAAGYRLGRTHGVRDTPLRAPVPRAFQHAPGRVALFGVVLVLVRAVPLYVERGHLATIALDPRYAGQPAPNVWPWGSLAARLIADVGAPPANESARLAAFLAGTAGGMLPDDVNRLLHETSDELHRLWLHVLLEGRQTRPVWDLRSGAVIPGGQPLDPQPPAAWGPVARPPEDEPV